VVYLEEETLRRHRLITIAVAGLMLGAVAACGDDSTDNAAATTASPATTTSSATAATGATGSTASTEPSAPTTIDTNDKLVIAQSLDPRGLFANGGTVAQEVSISGQITEKLLDFTTDGDDFQPVLATHWEQVNPTTLRLTLREGVTFTNGEPFTAESAVASLKVMLASPAYGGLTDMIADAAVVDPTTIDVTTKYPTGLTLNALAYGSYQYPPAYFAKVGVDGFSTAPIGTGPYMLKEWRRGEVVVLTSNEAYWGGAPAIETVEFRIIPDSAAQIAAVRSGDVDMVIGVPVGSYETVEGSDQIDLVTRPSNRVFGLMLSIRSDSPLKDPAVRRALWSGIDVDALIANQLGGKGTALEGQLLAPNYFGFNDSLKRTAYDPAKAKQLLADAGYPNGFKVKFNYSSGRYAQDREIGQALADQLAKIGVTTEQNVLEGGAFLTALNATELNDMYLAGYLPPPDAHFIYRNFKTGATPSYYSDPKLDAMIDAEANTSDQAARQQTFDDIGVFIQDEAPTVPLFQGVDAYAVSKKVQGFTPQASQFIPLHDMSMSS
jgi:peptide/nickel transport system substrate-binding protein